MKPACKSPARTADALDMPAVAFFLDPKTWTLQAGIFDRACKPPAMPMSCAAMSLPNTALKFGAVSAMRVAT